eukprot:TRINITY_DN9672_c0_g1_i1.p1 TRINITY_DN9672_c0_g1~~TRINITY_DN9672_c0_g1_i1.p1  ORF type:complete len:155 (+),score=6.08 TRINITY_DN9672_c0_g1_i1:98-562(+)
MSSGAPEREITAKTMNGEVVFGPVMTNSMSGHELKCILLKNQPEKINHVDLFIAESKVEDTTQLAGETSESLEVSAVFKSLSNTQLCQRDGHGELYEEYRYNSIGSSVVTFEKCRRCEQETRTIDCFHGDGLVALADGGRSLVKDKEERFSPYS